MMVGLRKNAPTVWLPKSVMCLRYYTACRLRSDLIAALILALEVFPACIAIAVASGQSVLNGISCAAAAGFLASALGESKIRISAPNVIFIAAASSIVGRNGIYGLSLCTLATGIWLIFLGATGLGAAVRFIPRPVVVGFSTGIAVLIVTGLLSTLLGISATLPTDQVRTGVGAVTHHLAVISPPALMLSAATLILALTCGKVSGRIPAGLVAIASGSLFVEFQHLPVQTIGAGYGSASLLFHTSAMSFDSFGGVLAQGLPIAVLAAIESIRAEGVASSLTGECPNPGIELLVHGVANVACSFLGGLPAAGSSAFTSANARSGAQTPVAGMLQGAFLLVLLFLTAPFVRYIPVAAISAILLLSICTMNHWGEIPGLVKSSRSDAIAWLATSLLTIATGLPTAMAGGMLIGMFLCIRKQR